MHAPRRKTVYWAVLACLGALEALGLGSMRAQAAPPDDEAARRSGAAHLVTAPNASGVAATLNLAGPIDRNNPFFQSLGSNGRSCATCHLAQEGWTITPQGVRERFEASHGLEPIFRLNDGANSPLADVSTRAARKLAYSMLLDKGLIRVDIGIPDGARFELLKVDDPSNFASAKELSLFRRPLPTTNDAGRLSTPDARRSDAEGRDRSVAVARGQALFNGRQIPVSGVKGINDDLHITTLVGSCTTCHDTPNAGNPSIPMPLNIGVADASRRTPDMPLYTLRHKETGALIETADPGRALGTGRWQELGRFKGPTLRALAVRAPYFHNGAAVDPPAVVKFCNHRFDIGFSEDEQRDPVSFLKAL